VSRARVVDTDGYRPNVGIILANSAGQVLWARRVGQDAWQFPQGGIRRSESPREAMFRELHEEVGLCADHVEVLGCTRGWLRYRLPRRMLRNNASSFVGQKQKWFLLKLLCCDDEVCVDHSQRPEFDFWRWVSYWYPVGQVVSFKQEVYRRALKELAPNLPHSDR
jgi:putative (di)nucleoside polyphosphate hydrolase